MIKGFREFIMRGNVIDLAVAVVIGAAFGAVITAFVADIIMPIIALIFGKPDFSGLTFKISGTVFPYGLFVTALVNFLLIAAAIYFIIVAPMNALNARRAKAEEVTTKQCPECLSEIPRDARRCAFCASEQPGAAA
jgi:large conductance mechanosensitive channel